MELTAKYQDTKLLNDMLERHYYASFRDPLNTNFGKEIELFLFGNCSFNCQYCYLKKNEKELYPSSLNTSQENILYNLELLLNWYIENRFLCNFNIFSSNWLDTSISDKILNLFYNKFKNSIYKPKKISMADNMLFLNSIERQKKIQYYIDLFKSINIEIKISASVDGKECDFGRTEVSDEFYQNLINFLDKNKFFAHPMISSSNVKHWIKNHIWWQENAPKYLLESLMMLEIRDNNWDLESINYLIQFLDYLVDYYYIKIFKKNKLEFLKFVLGLKTDVIQYPPSYRTIGLVYTGIFENKDFIPCSFHNNLVIRVADLSLGLCHRLFYPEFIIGNFLINESKITSVNDNIASLEILKYHLKQSSLPHCENCNFNGVCNKFCLGSAYENQTNMLVPPKSVCEMQRAKISFLFFKYNTLDLFAELKNINLPENIKQYYLDLNQIINNNFGEKNV